MIAIKDMKMPKSCMRCQVSDSVPDCPCKGNTLIFNYRDKRHPDCPLIEIGTCKDCKHWQRIGYAIPSNGRCKHFDDVWRGNSILPLEHGTTENFYCADFEKRDNNKPKTYIDCQKCENYRNPDYSKCMECEKRGKENENN